MDDNTLDTWVNCLQRVLVPCVVIIGVLGNILNIIVLTRRRMRCSTNIYLTALAATDLMFLIFVFILSLQHYPNIHHPKYKLYWSTIGLSHWFYKASLYTSIYLTVSFTVERYMAVCHVWGQVPCTESRAKRVIAVVVILCFLLSVTTAFEYKLVPQIKHIHVKTGETCTKIIDELPSTIMLHENLINNNNGLHQNITNLDVTTNINGPTDYNANINKRDTLSINNSTNNNTRNQNLTLYTSHSTNSTNINIENSAIFNKLINNSNMVDKLVDNENGSFHPTIINDNVNIIWRNEHQLPSLTLDNLIINNIGNNNNNNNIEIEDDLYNDILLNTNNITRNSFIIDTACQKLYFIYAHESNFGKIYKNIFFVFSSIFFTLIPLLLLATFNCFLGAAVYRSRKIQHQMTNSRQQQYDICAAQENKMTITVIAVVVFFLICQTPKAIYLIYKKLDDVMTDSNIHKVAENIFDFLPTVNATCHALLYYAFSNKYRKTLSYLFCNRKLSIKDAATVAFTRCTIGNTSHTPSFYNGNKSSTTITTENLSNIRNRLPRNSIVGPDELKLIRVDTKKQLENISVHNLNSPRQSISSPSTIDPRPILKVPINNETTSRHSPQQTNVNLENSINTPTITKKSCNHHENRFLKPSPSQVSLTRTRSLNYPTKPRHSPNCKDNPHNL